MTILPTMTQMQLLSAAARKVMSFWLKEFGFLFAPHRMGSIHRLIANITQGFAYVYSQNSLCMLPRQYLGTVLINGEQNALFVSNLKF